MEPLDKPVPKKQNLELTPFPKAPREITKPRADPSKTLKFGTIVGQYNDYEFEIKVGIQRYRVKNATATEIEVGNSAVFVFSEEGSYIVGKSKSIARKRTKIQVSG